MNKKQSIPYIILLVTPLFFGCGGSAKNKTKTSKPESALSLHLGDEKYIPVDTKESVMTWKGWNVFTPNSQTGYIYLSNGELLVESGEIKGGTVEVDMNSIEDRKHAGDNKLVNHLKDPDFFDVKKFPFSTIAITKVVPTNGRDKEITGNLTIKGITHPVTFPVKTEVKDGTVKVNGKVLIDRTLWDVRYNSGKFYDNLANKTMSDSIELHINIVAKK